MTVGTDAAQVLHDFAVPGDLAQQPSPDLSPAAATVTLVSSVIPPGYLMQSLAYDASTRTLWAGCKDLDTDPGWRNVVVSYDEQLNPTELAGTYVDARPRFPGDHSLVLDPSRGRLVVTEWDTLNVMQTIGVWDTTTRTRLAQFGDRCPGRPDPSRGRV
jgi:hypothetical protein